MMNTRPFGLCGNRVDKVKRIISVFMIISLIFVSGCIFQDSNEEIDFHTSKTREESEYCKVILDEVIRCLDEEDDALQSLFSENNNSKYNLERQIEKAMEAYDGKSVSCDVYAYERDRYNVHNGYFSLKCAYVEYRKVTMDSGEEYLITVFFCLVNDENPERIGMDGIEILDADSLDTIAEIGY